MQRTMTNNAVIYLRVSSDEQARNGYGLDDQLDKCTALATKERYHVLSVQRDEGISGSKGMSERPGLSAAMGMVLSGEADVLIVAASDRLARHTELNAHLRNVLERAGAKLHSAKDGILTDPSNIFLADILGAVAAKERRDIAARLHGGRQQRSKRDGMGSGFLPLGYRWSFSEDGTRHISIDPSTAKAVTEVLTMRDAGKSYAEIAQAMNEAGYKTAKGVAWSRESVRLVTGNRELYATGKRTWEGIEASEQWPVLYSSGG